MFPRVLRNANVAMSIALGLTLGPLPAAAQTPMTPPGSPKGATESTDRSGMVGVVEGSVKKVDPGAGTLQLKSGPLGIISRTFEVGEGTPISVDGHQGTLADIQEGTKVKAAYEWRDGKNIATRIEVLPAQ